MAIDIVKQKLRREKDFNLDSKIRGALKNRVLDGSQIIEVLKRQKKTIDHGHDVNSLIIYKLKEDYRREQEPVLIVSDIKDDYNLIVNDESVVNPFIISSGLVKLIRKRTKYCNGTGEKAQAIYDWTEKNIEYDTNKGSNCCKNSKETLVDRQGICSEMSFLYITMARCCNLRSAYVSVSHDCYNKKVNHGCAVVDVGSRDVLVDPAYHAFDIKHKNYKILTDAEVLERFNQWRFA